MCRSSLSLALGMLLGAAAHAQQKPAIGEAVRQAVPPALPAEKPPGLPTVGGVPTEPPMQALPGGGTEVVVREFAVIGNRVIDSATLLALVQPEQGGSLSLAQLDAMATRITHYYRTKGYFVARAYIPAQEIVDGKLTIRVVEGNYGKFILSNHSLVRDDVVQGLLDDIKDRDIVSLDTLERAMLIINDTPGVKVVRADVMPGEQVGTSDFAIGTEAMPAYNGYILFDNDGSTYTGKQRLLFNADWNSPSGRGDRLSGSGMVTNHTGLLYGQLAYSMLLGTDGTRAEVAVSRITYELSGIYQALDATGTANGAELNFSKPLKRTRNDSIAATLSLAYRDLTDKVGATATELTKRSASISMGISEKRDHALFGYSGLSQGSVSVTAGSLHFKDELAAALDALGARSRGGYGKLNLSASRISSLPSQWTLTTSIKAQASLGSKALDGFERMSVTGAAGVAAYPTSELSGDHAALARVELARPLLVDGPVPLSVSAFTDYGWAKVEGLPDGVKDSRGVGDVGLSLSAFTAGGALLKLQVAHRTAGGPPLSESASRNRVLFQVGWVR
jgi:hemolysin activation/secretion protein